MQKFRLISWSASAGMMLTYLCRVQFNHWAMLSLLLCIVMITLSCAND